MILTIFLNGLTGLAAFITIYLDYKFTDKRTKKFKRLRVVMIIILMCSFFLSSLISYRDKNVHDNGREELIAKINELQESEDSLKIIISELELTMSVIETTLGNLGKLKDLSGKDTYCVRIAKSNNYEDLEIYRQNIYNMFSGAKESGMVDISSNQTQNGVIYYELYFGTYLDVSSAEVFHRLAMSHNFPPTGDIAIIKKCKDSPAR